MIDCGFGINHEYKNISIKAMIIDPFVQIWANIYTRTKMDLVGLHSQQYKKTCSLSAPWCITYRTHSFVLQSKMQNCEMQHWTETD